ncbi:MAG: FUSC family protein, partial [Actinomycetota bacterium]
LWPSRRRADLRRAAASAIDRIVDVLETGDGVDEARTTVQALERSFLGSQHRPAGPTAATAALVSAPDELSWLLGFLPVQAETDEEEEALAAVASVLRASAGRLRGGDVHADFARLERAREALAESTAQHLPELSEQREVGRAFRMRAVTSASEHLAAYAMRATGGNLPPVDRVGATTSTARAAEQLLLEHASPRSIWLQNSLRAAVALAVAVYVAQRAGLHYAFWVVLGTLSVLRSNALGTGRSVVGALAGTTAGIVVGGALVAAIGTHTAVLWALLPVGILIAAYAPRAVSFAAGQAGFTIVLFVLFNLIQPVGWRIGVVRVEDIAIGCGVSLGVGLLFWPRGTARLLRADLADAYATAADYLLAALNELIGTGGRDETERHATAVDTSLHRLDDTFRQYVAERSATPVRVEDVAALVGGATRVRRAASSLDEFARLTPANTCALHLAAEANALHTWFVAFGDSLVRGRTVGPPHLRDERGRQALFDCARGADPGDRRPALRLVSAIEYVEGLRALETHLGERANALA